MSQRAEMDSRKRPEDGACLWITDRSSWICGSLAYWTISRICEERNQAKSSPSWVFSMSWLETTARDDLLTISRLRTEEGSEVSVPAIIELDTPVPEFKALAQIGMGERSRSIMMYNHWVTMVGLEFESWSIISVIKSILCKAPGGQFLARWIPALAILEQFPDWRIYMTMRRISLSSHSRNLCPGLSWGMVENTMWWSLDVAAPTQWKRNVTRVNSGGDPGPCLKGSVELQLLSILESRILDPVPLPNIIPSSYKTTIDNKYSGPHQTVEQVDKI